MPLLTGLGLGALILGPALGPGFVLSYDMVFVPDPAVTDAMFGRTGGFPRQVPSDAVAAGLSFIPGSQQLILLTIFVLAAAGMARLVPGGMLPRLAAAAFFVWNPYVAERLLLGHWALLLGYAGLPWVLDAVINRRRIWQLALALLPAAIGGFAAMNLTALVVIGALIALRGRGTLRTAGVFLAAALPWLVPALQAGGTTDPRGVDLFAARADTPFGTLGSLISLGGIWNAEAVPPGFSPFLPALLRLLVCLAALAALITLRTPVARAALYAGAMGLAIACIGITPPGRAALQNLIGLWPGFGVLRDGQLYIGVLALAASIGLGRLATPRPWLGIIPLAVLPTLAWGVGGRLDAVHYPSDWRAAQQLMAADPVQGKVLSLPWGAYRRFAWNPGAAVLDPLPRMLSRQVVWNDGLQVDDQHLAQEDPLAVQADGLLRAPGDLPAALSRAGYRYVVLSKDSNEGELRIRLSQAKTVLDGPTLIVYLLEHASQFGTNSSTLGPP